MTNMSNAANEEVDNVKDNEAVEAVNNDKALGSPSAPVSENADASESSKLEGDIIRQVEYYFGDENLYRDKFLLEQIAKDEEGWVPISLLVSFKRLAALSTDPLIIANALLKVNEGLVEVSDDKEKLRRNPELPIPEISDEHRKERSSRTVYVKGFPLDSTIDTLIDYFKSFKKVVHVFMRKYKCTQTQTQKFKGSVFITFETKEQAEDFIKNSQAKHNDHFLICKWQEDYLNEKRAENMAKNKSKKEKPKDEIKVNLPKGAILYFDGVSAIITREDLREAIEKITKSKIAYIDFSKGESCGHIRFSDDDAANEFMKELGEAKLKVKDDEINIRTVNDEEEKAYMIKAAQAMHSRRQSKQKSRKRKARNDTFEAKKVKTADD